MNIELEANASDAIDETTPEQREALAALPDPILPRSPDLPPVTSIVASSDVSMTLRELPPEIVCLSCNWMGRNSDLVIPHYILDDDGPDYGGDCPECGENSLDGKMIDYEEHIAERAFIASTETLINLRNLRYYSDHIEDSFERTTIIRKYAARYVHSASDHETLSDFVEQAALDLKDRSIKRELRAAIKEMERTVSV